MFRGRSDCFCPPVSMKQGDRNKRTVPSFLLLRMSITQSSKDRIRLHFLMFISSSSYSVHAVPNLYLLGLPSFSVIVRQCVVTWEQTIIFRLAAIKRTIIFFCRRISCINIFVLLIFGGKWLCFVNSISLIMPCKYISFN